MDEERPSRICQECTERLLNAYDFICSVEKAELDIENYFKTDKQHHPEEVIDQLDEEDVKIDATDIDVEDIEILEEEFQIEQEPTVYEKKEDIIEGEIDAVCQSDDLNQ